ncbi:ATP-binding protein [Litchfieldella xinjiangensis]|uniref:ATP-binding protein n=1 Tax=Litchfieldella xinjiangensis TaxID=1166948 RepID=UPI0005BE239A|nr:ATP-binding protein [Halomonas xinjiangensis]
MAMRTRLLLMLLSAPLLVMMLLFFLSIRQDAQVRENALASRMVTAAELVAPALSDALSRQATPAVERSVQQLLDINEVRGLRLQDNRGEVLLSRGQRLGNVALPPTSASQVVKSSDHWQVQVPLPTSAYDSSLPRWLIVSVDTASLTLGTYQRLIVAALIGLVLGMVLFLMAYQLSRHLVRPFHEANQTLQRLAKGDYHHRMTPQAPREADRLASGINTLAEHMQHAQEDMHRHIEQTTQDLQESMETIEIKNIELDLAHRRALEANRIKTEFLANMSHEIRTPLNGIIGFCQLLSRSRLDNRQQEWLEHVHKASDSLLSLINDILDFSKIEAGKMELEALDLDILDLVDEVLGLQAPEAHQKRLQLLGLVYDDVPANLQGDPLRIKQVLTNLVHNAIKFTEHGEVIVRVMVEEYQTSQVILKVSVSDTGIGLDPESRERLFKAFSQASISDSRQYGGTGLGLLICRQLVEQMGGTIDVDSQLGKGTTFAFTLPLRARSFEERKPELSLQGAPIALYETHAPTCHALEHLLECWGATVLQLDTPAANPEQTPALLLAGLQNDELDGEALKNWQACLDGIDCPAVLLVNANSLELPNLRLPQGGEILTRPLSRAALAATIKRLLVPHEAAEVRHSNAPSRSLRIMVVDDTVSNRLLVKELLTDLGLEPLLAASGEEALAVAQSEPVDLVLMDIRLPGIDGVATAHALRRLGGSWRHCPIIAVTAHALEEERKRLLQQGMHDVLIKPIDGHALARLLSQHLNQPLQLPIHTLDTLPDVPEASLESELPIVDMGLGISLAGGHVKLAEDTLDRLLESLDQSEADLRDAWETQDTERFLDIVHGLNGACRYCGVPQLALVAETLETRLRTRGLPQVGPLLGELFDAMDRLRTWQSVCPAHASSTTNAQANSSSSLNDK